MSGVNRASRARGGSKPVEILQERKGAMHAITFIQTQLNGIHQLFHEYADDLTRTEWTKPVLPQSNLLGFTLWHIVRTRDWAVQTAIRGVPEVIADERWAGWSGLAHA